MGRAKSFFFDDAPRVGLWGARGAQVVKKIKHGHVAYQIDVDDKQNQMKVNNYILGSN